MPKLRGFATQTPDFIREASRKGGISAHAQGTAHTYSSAEAKIAGQKGGFSPHVSRGGRVKCLTCLQPHLGEGTYDHVPSYPPRRKTAKARDKAPHL